MRSVLFAASLALLLAASMTAGAARAGEWRVERIDTPARVSAVETVDGQPRVNAGGLWYRIELTGDGSKLSFVDAPGVPERPQGALPDGRVAIGTRDIARAWLAEPTARYDHGVLGDAVEAASLAIEQTDGTIQTVRLKGDAVFEDLEPRLADLDGDGRDEVIVVKSYLARGASLAVVALRKGRDMSRYEIVAETPPLGSANRWLNPAAIGDFNGDGKTDIALVRQPHVVGELELWTFADGRLRKTSTLSGVSNHIIGSRALRMSAAADFDGDGIMDIALPSLDRSRLRIVSFAPHSGAPQSFTSMPRDIASVALPAKAVTDVALIIREQTPPAVAAGLSDGSLVAIRSD